MSETQDNHKTDQAWGTVTKSDSTTGLSLSDYKHTGKVVRILAMTTAHYKKESWTEHLPTPPPKMSVAADSLSVDEH